MKPKRARKPPTVLRPQEFSRLLLAAPPAILPVIVLGGFCALRLSEILLLNWSAIDLTRKEASVVSSKHRRLARLVPLPEAAVAWLSQVVMKSGRVADYSSTFELCQTMRRLWQAEKIKWGSGHLRFSARTYLIHAAPKSTNTAETNMESSENMKNCQRNELLKADADLWFSIFPSPHR